MPAGLANYTSNNSGSSSKNNNPNPHYGILDSSAFLFPNGSYLYYFIPYRPIGLFNSLNTQASYRLLQSPNTNPFIDPGYVKKQNLDGF